MKRPRILVSEVLDPEAIALLRLEADVEAHEVMRGQEFDARLGEFDAVIIRSAHRLTAEHFAGAPRLRVAARAGAGVDNIDLEAATRHGVLVLNTPGANAVAAAEQTFGLMLAAARRTIPADRHVRSGGWRRQDYVGFELRGRRVGIIGIGRVGREVARIARGFGMQVFAYDPYVPEEDIRARGATPVATLEELIGVSDVLTIHTPKTGPRLDRDRLALLPDGALVLNVARGGLVDEEALLDLLDAGRIACAALDVFEREPPANPRLLGRDDVVVSCHLGGSTREALGQIGMRVAKVVLRALRGEVPDEAVNLPFPQFDAVAPQQVLAAADCAGRILTEIAEASGLLVVAARGGLPAEALPISARALLAGYLSPVSDVPVNVVNALIRAQERGIGVELRQEEPDGGPPRIAAWFAGGQERDVEVAVEEGRLRRLLGARLDLRLGRHLLFTRHRDLPGVVGRVGTLLGAAGVNIATLELDRSGAGEAIMALELDEEPAAQVMQALLALPEVSEVHAVALRAVPRQEVAR